MKFELMYLLGFKNVAHFELELRNYIRYYNNDRKS
ncbi:MAG: IS3 family transposase [Bacteroidaceae bacterium]|nr:IS3 family transposase [Bacteroidaceae bacterium]